MYFILQVTEFADVLKGSESFYGLKPDTINSLLLSLITLDEYTFKTDKPQISSINSSDALVQIVHAMKEILQSCMGFQLVEVSLILLCNVTEAVEINAKLQ